MKKISPAAKKAILIGGMCSLSYLAVYAARNILGTVSPQMIEDGRFTTENVGILSSLYFFTYAAGQLINGIIGDKIKAKYMISFGLGLAGICSLLFPLISHSVFASYIIYGMTGFFLSMIYGPMTKIVAENTEPIYATRCSLGYTFASFFGSPVAGVMAFFLVWQAVFISSSAVLLIMSIICFVVFSIFEKRGLVQYNKYKIPKGNGGGVKILFKYQIVKFTLVSILTGVVRTTVVFWLPTYISQYLGFSSENAALIFTVATFIISLSTFVAIFVYEQLRRNMDLTILLFFAASALSFLIVFFINEPTTNIIFMILGIMTSDCASAMLWSQYCPSLRDTGMVSSATGFLDCVSYLAAALSSTLFANAVTVIGWGNLILIWFGLMALGVFVTLPYRAMKRRI